MTLAATIERSRREPESWRYTDLSQLLNKARKSDRDREHSFSVVTEKTDNAPFLLFKDGVWVVKESNLEGLPSGIVQGDSSVGYRLVIAGQTCLVTQPMELRFLITQQAPLEISTRVHIELGESGRLSLMERHEVEPGVVSNQAHLLEVDISLARQAKFVHSKIVGQASVHISETRVVVAEGAYYDNFTLIKNGLLTRNEIHVNMQDPMAQVALNGIMLLDHASHADTATVVNHAAPHGTSRQYYKTVVRGQAHGVFQGKVVVAPLAAKTDSRQMSRALILSDQAEVDMKPELEIFADDVKCSHGSTVGDLDTEALFYMRSRGVPEAEARAFLIRAFAEEVVDQIQVSEWRNLFLSEIERWLNECG